MYATDFKIYFSGKLIDVFVQRGGIANVSVNCILKRTAKEKALVLFSASI